jgi:uncharacterized protein
MYHAGWGVPKDCAEALKWYRLAAEQGHSGAQNKIGLMYLDVSTETVWRRIARNR